MARIEIKKMSVKKVLEEIKRLNRDGKEAHLKTTAKKIYIEY